MTVPNSANIFAGYPVKWTRYDHPIRPVPDTLPGNSISTCLPSVGKPRRQQFGRGSRHSSNSPRIQTPNFQLRALTKVRAPIRYPARFFDSHELSMKGTSR